MSKYGTIPDPNSSTTPAPPPPEGSRSSSTVSALVTLRPWRELADPRALAVPPAGLAAARRRVHANLARFAANYRLTFLIVVSASLLWRWRPVCLPTVLLCLAKLSSNKYSLFSMTLTLFQLVVTGAAACVLVTVPMGLLLVGVHAVLHRPDDGADEEAAAGSVVWHAGIAPCDAPAAGHSTVNELA
ncbi:unnamed protein product [Urochloa decumbens]|uniref:PRA1 family protein n=1 Tax=Urochloa decumbens TaxID=240449 RepID=A0ABC8VRA5_9POAL